MDRLDIAMKFITIIIENIILNSILSYTELTFFCRLKKCSIKTYQYVIYAVLLNLVMSIEVVANAPFWLSTLMELASLCLFGIVVLKYTVLQSGINSVVTVTLMQLVGGLFIPLHSYQ